MTQAKAIKHLCLWSALSALSLFSLTACQVNTYSDDNITYQEQVSATPPEDLSPELYLLAKKIYRRAWSQGLTKSPIFTVIDYSLPSNQKRLWTFNIRTNKLYFHEFVAHGSGSGKLMATSFSNILGSHQTSIGLYRTQNVYKGKYGPALHLKGLEPGFNDNAFRRHIVLHGSAYVGQRFTDRYGYTGRSWGCPVVNKNLVGKITNTIKDGSLLLMYYPKGNWIAHSRFLNV